MSGVLRQHRDIRAMKFVRATLFFPAHPASIRSNHAFSAHAAARATGPGLSQHAAPSKRLYSQQLCSLLDDSKCFKVQANSKQLRDRWVEELTQAQKRVAVAVPEKGMRVDYEPRPSFFQPSSFVDRQRETVSSTELEDLPSAPRVSDGSGDVLGSNSSPLLSAMQPAAIESDHVFYRGAHLSFNDFLLTASSESEWCVSLSAVTQRRRHPKHANSPLRPFFDGLIPFLPAGTSSSSCPCR